MSLARAAAIAAAATLIASTLGSTVATADPITETLTSNVSNVDTGVHIGTITYTQTGRKLTFHADLENLLPNYPYWVANYPNDKCEPSRGRTSSGDPSFGIVLTDANGDATFDRAVATGDFVPRYTKSVSIRRGDNSHDIDGDGKTGWTDEVGVYNHIRLGLIGCDTNPVHS